MEPSRADLDPETNHEAAMKLSYFYPLLGFVVPTVVIGFGFVIPKSCIAGMNDLTIGFAITVASACVTYWVGLRTVLRDVTSVLHNNDEVPEWRVRIIVQHEGQTIAPS
jgi:ABC-type Fe3+ transport system permease subunit